MRFVDVEALARTYLLTGSYSGGASVYIKVPSARPDTFLRVWRTGGPSKNRVLDVPMITVESWSSKSDKHAVDNGNTARQMLLNASGVMPLVRGVEEVTGLHYDPDPDTGITRYSFTVRMRVRASRV